MNSMKIAAVNDGFNFIEDGNSKKVEIDGLVILGCDGAFFSVAIV